jgi:hypothetical protein
MTDLNHTIASVLAARYQKLADVLGELASPLSDAQFWTKPFDFGNSFGHLMLHLTGNLNYYIGAQIAGTGYVRDRPLEFSDATRPSKAGVLEQFNQAVDMVVTTINSQSAEDWATAYTAAGSDADNRLGIVLSCATHLHLHIGQMMYLAGELKRKN